MLVELYRVAFDPLKEISFISDEYNKFELEGSLLADTTKPFDAVLGQFTAASCSSDGEPWRSGHPDSRRRSNW